MPIRHIPQFLEWLVLGFTLVMSSRRECYEWWHLKEPQSNTHWWVIKVIRLFSADDQLESESVTEKTMIQGSTL